MFSNLMNKAGELDRDGDLPRTCSHRSFDLSNSAPAGEGQAGCNRGETRAREFLCDA